VDRTVPPPHRSVMEVEVVQGGGSTLHHRGAGQCPVLGDQRGEIANILLEEIEDAGDPPFTEPDPGAYPLVDQFRGAGVDGLLEHRDAAFMPYPAPQEQWG